METQQFRDLLKKYEANQLSDQDRQMVERWYDDYEEDEFDGFKDAAHAQQIKASIREAIEVQVPLKKIITLQWRNIYRYAAIITFVIATAAALLWKPQHGGRAKQTAEFTVITTKAGENKVLTLQDHSIVHLNPSSSLRLSSRFGTLSRRDVYLDQGEAFFEVSKDPRHPFLVHAQQLTTQVLGTKFKVSNHANHTTEVSVSEGKVQILSHKRSLALLLPGKKLILDRQHHTWKKTDFAITENNRWYKAVTNLNDASFEELSGAMKINYGIVLSSTDPNVINYRYNLQLRTERSLEETMKMICSVHQNNYRRVADDIVMY